MIAGRLSGSVIEIIHDGSELGLALPSQIPVFREKLTDQAVRVFVEPSFPPTRHKDKQSRSVDRDPESSRNDH